MELCARNPQTMGSYVCPGFGVEAQVSCQRARPRLRRLRSAGLSLRGLGFGLVPVRWPPIGSAVDFTGARLRASRQMKNAIPPSPNAAPIAIPIALLPLRPLSCEVVADPDGA